MSSPLRSFEFSTKPWFGPTKRAREQLLKRTRLLEPKAALTQIFRMLGNSRDFIEHARFVDFIHRSRNDFRFTIVLLWTYSNSRFRQQLFDMADDVVEQTGWYPLVLGERIYSGAAERRAAKTIDFDASQLSLRGPFENITSAVQPNEGCSIRLECEFGTILFDTGLPSYLIPSQSDSLVLISHVHSDHVGGLITGRAARLPVIMSSATYQILVAQGYAFSNPLLLLEPDDSWVNIGQNLELRCFTTPHAPGSIGYVLRDSSAAIIYTGDICLRTSRYDFTATLHQHINSSDRNKKFLLLDATMAGRTEGASMTNSAHALVSLFDNSDDILIISRDTEQLLYAYLDIFHHVQRSFGLRSTINFIATYRLRILFQIIHNAFINRQFNKLDPILFNQYGRSMSAWAESCWLYWFASPSMLPESPQKRLWLCGANDTLMIPKNTRIQVVTLGVVSRDALPETVRDQVVDFDASPWTLHTNSEELRSFIADLQPDITPIAFHDFPNRLKKVIKSTGLRCGVLDRVPITCK